MLFWTQSHTTGFVFSCSNPTGYTVIIGQPTSNPDPESPKGQSQSIPLPMPMPPPGPQSPGSASAAGEENPGETLPESKWLVRDTWSDWCTASSIQSAIIISVLLRHVCQLFVYLCCITASPVIHNKPTLTQCCHVYELTCLIPACLSLKCLFACCWFNFVSLCCCCQRRSMAEWGIYFQLL